LAIDRTKWSRSRIAQLAAVGGDDCSLITHTNDRSPTASVPNHAGHCCMERRGQCIVLAGPIARARNSQWLTLGYSSGSPDEQLIATHQIEQRHRGGRATRAMPNPYPQITRGIRCAPPAECVTCVTFSHIVLTRARPSSRIASQGPCCDSRFPRRCSRTGPTSARCPVLDPRMP